jgi:hypothetical protein
MSYLALNRFPKILRRTRSPNLRLISRQRVREKNSHYKEKRLPEEKLQRRQASIDRLVFQTYKKLIAIVSA